MAHLLTDQTLHSLATELRAGRLQSRQLVASALERILDPDGEGTRAFVEVDQQAAFEAATACDMMLADGRDTLPLLGIPISVKDLFDIEGQVTRAGSVILADAPPATRDAPAIARLRAAGAVFIGRTNMTEFAFSGIGINPHYGTPANPFDRASTPRIPGGSSSGAAVSVTDGMAAAAIGTDTGGSTRIPPALCGAVGFKPTARRIPTEGAFPLSASLDSVGPIARSVGCCILLDQIMSGSPVRTHEPATLRGLRLLVPRNHLTEHLDDDVAHAFAGALAALANAGAELIETRLEALDMLGDRRVGAGLAPVEAYAVHRAWYHEREADYDPRVHGRIAFGADASAADYIDMLAWRKAFIEQATAECARYDAIIAPTVPCIAPVIADIVAASDDDYFKTNARVLRNTSVVNALDGCALTIPCHQPGEAPVGLTIAGTAMQDEHILRIGLGVEDALRP